VSSVVITLQSDLLQGGTIDLELPAEVPLQDLLPPLVRALGIAPNNQAGQSMSYQLSHHRRRHPMQGSETLRDAGVATGDVLSLVSVGPHPGARRSSTAGVSSRSALLRCESGTVIALDNYGKHELSVGRYDARTGDSPDIDLSEEPGGGTVSRSHALLRKRGSQWVLIPFSTKNRTHVGNARIGPNQSHPLKSGDNVTLGSVRLVFETGRRS
jgi:uncharacterized ubiquitin-like protein YukD